MFGTGVHTYRYLINITVNVSSHGKDLRCITSGYEYVSLIVTYSYHECVMMLPKGRVWFLPIRYTTREVYASDHIVQQRDVINVRTFDVLVRTAFCHRHYG